MKFLYEYRTRDNVIHEDAVSAPTRDEAFARLKSRGIKPARLVEAPGFFNRLFGKGKRWLAIAVLCALCVLLCALSLRSSQQAKSSSHRARIAADVFDDTTRRQVIGDTMVVELGIRTGWMAVFPEEGERFLASFAIPGVPAGQRTTTEDELRAALARRIVPTDSDTLESRQIKSMVEGMKRELREFLADGGSVAGYGRRLVERQEAELAIRNRVVNELATAKRSGLSDERLEALWESRNGELRQMGIRLVPLPE